MRTKLKTLLRRSTDADLPADEIHLPTGKLRMLKSAIPFHHSPAEQEHPDPVCTDAPPPLPARRKWHDDHDAMVEDYDTDVVLVERHGKLPGPETSL